MLQVVAPYVAEMLHLKSLTINRVAGVAGFQTMSTCKSYVKSLTINMVVGVFDGFLSLSSLRLAATRTPIQATGDGSIAATPVRARPRALRYDSIHAATQFNAPQRMAAALFFGQERRGRYAHTLLPVLRSTAEGGRPGPAALLVRGRRALENSC
jgi:hypothetical protein